MDCGVPFCNNGCPLGNLIPDWNDLVRTGHWREAIDQLHATNNFPEFTGLICPAPCESACVLAINDDPVMIKQIEYWTIDNAFEEGWVVAAARPRSAPAARSPSSAPARPASPPPTSSTRSATRSPSTSATRRLGGLLRFGVPDAKLEKWIIDRRVDVLEAEGIELPLRRRGRRRHLASRSCASDHDAVVLAIGSRVERDLEVPGRELDGVHFAMDYLYQRNRAVAREEGASPRRRARGGDHRRGQARRRDRRRRHRHGLRLQRDARGRDRA